MKSTNDTKEEVISVVLIPDDKSLQHFLDISAKLQGSLFRLDDVHLPHVTIAQFKAPFLALPELKSDVKELEGVEYNLEISGLNFVPDAQRGRIWVELQVLKTQALLDLQRQILATEFAKKYELQNWGVGDTYRPHITIGLIDGLDRIPGVQINELSETLHLSLSAKVVSGKNGEYFSFTGGS